MIIVPDSHLDHGLTTAQLSWLLREMSRPEYNVQHTPWGVTRPAGPGTLLKTEHGVETWTFELPAELGQVESLLYGPAAGDEPIPEAVVHYSVRGDRGGKSRRCPAPARQTSTVTVVAGPFGDHKRVLYTAYPGPPAPREPFDVGDDAEALAESEAFWTIHALADPEWPRGEWSWLKNASRKEPDFAAVIRRIDYGPAGPPVRLEADIFVCDLFGSGDSEHVGYVRMLPMGVDRRPVDHWLLSAERTPWFHLDIWADARLRDWMEDVEATYGNAREVGDRIIAALEASYEIEAG